MKKKVVLIDNNDSFTFNLVELLRQLACDFTVINIKDLQLNQLTDFSHIIISPGPDVPKAYPKIYEMLERFYPSKVILGVCLGHQIICDFFGANVYNLASPRHGMTGYLTIDPHCHSLIFKDLPNQFQVGLYHSWAVSGDDFPSSLQVTATCQDEIVMAIEHGELPIFGVQFHPESYISQFGKEILENFLNCD